MNVSAIIVTRGMEERFWAKVDRRGEDECWLWQGATSNGGYGAFWAGLRSEGGSPIPTGAHRVAYIIEHGSIPDDLELDHLCRTPACVNAAHLEAVTRLENQRRGFSPMQAQRKQTHCKRGHPLDADNTYVWHGMRRCRACQAADARRYRERKRCASL